MLRLSLVSTSELLIVVASLVAEHVPWGAWASVAAAREYSWHMSTVVEVLRLWSVGLVLVMHGLSCLAASETFSDQGSNSSPLHWQVDS